MKPEPGRRVVQLLGEVRVDQTVQKVGVHALQRRRKAVDMNGLRTANGCQTQRGYITDMVEMLVGDQQRPNLALLD